MVWNQQQVRRTAAAAAAAPYPAVPWSNLSAAASCHCLTSSRAAAQSACSLNTSVSAMDAAYLTAKRLIASYTVYSPACLTNPSTVCCLPAPPAAADHSTCTSGCPAVQRATMHCWRSAPAAMTLIVRLMFWTAWQMMRWSLMRSPMRLWHARGLGGHTCARFLDDGLVEHVIRSSSCNGCLE